MSEIKWEDPPRPTRERRTRTDWVWVASKLKSRPGVWARVATKDSFIPADSLVNNIRRGVLKGLPKGEFQVKFVQISDEFRVYCRYVGTENV